jgi:predicted nuclease of predicted toxin-antitoxin system
MVGLLIDECMSPRLPGRFHELGFHALHVRDRDMLTSNDDEVWNLAQSEGLTICTVNGKDFRQLARKGPHHGLIVIPSGGNPEQQFKWTASGILQGLRSNTGTGLQSRYIEVDENSEIAAVEFDDLSRFN